MNKLVRLPLPDLSMANFLFRAKQYRPYRKGGLRLEHEVIQGKHIFHNYGHGGAGISLAYGSGYISAKSLSTYVGPSKLKSAECAVLGCGIMGLFTAIELAKRGYTVRLYAAEIPQKSATNNLIASQIAAGKWQPGGYDLNADYLKHEILAKLSFEYYLDCIRTKRYRAIKPIKVYDAYDSIQQLQKTNTSFLIDDYTPVEVEYPNGKLQKYTEFSSIVINTDVFLQELITQAKLRGVEIHLRKFDNLSQVLAMKEDIIMNCTGYGARQLFGDQNVLGKKGHLWFFKNVNNVNYMLAARHNNSHVTIYGVDDKLIVGTTYLDQQFNEEKDNQHYDRILKNAMEYFGQSAPRPRL